MEAWGRLFTDDVDFVNRGGGWWKSNRENVRRHQAIHGELIRQKQRMNYSSPTASIVFLDPAIALVHATWRWPGFVLAPRQRAGKGIITMVMVKRGGQWLIRASHNTVNSDSRSGTTAGAHKNRSRKTNENTS
jgi:uncharacterized protein (TIGR02246 family)